MDDKIKLFVFSNQITERALDSIEQDLNLDLERDTLSSTDKDEDYYPQFEQGIRNKAKEMASHYELFYCLEVSIRQLIREKLKAELGENWWEKAKITPEIQKNVADNMKRDVESAFTPRSDNEIDYTNFGELGDIVRNNWEHFGDVFNNQKAFNRVMNNLNLLRGPIAHCSPLADDEVLRLRLTVADWFRLMA